MISSTVQQTNNNNNNNSRAINVKRDLDLESMIFEINRQIKIGKREIGGAGGGNLSKLRNSPLLDQLITSQQA